MGRAIGMKKAELIGARIAGKHDPNAPKHMIYVPAHMKAGNFISQRVSFSVYVNANRGKKDPATGKVQADNFNCTAWGKLADAIARGGSVGRAFDLFCTPTSYLKPIVDAAGNPVMNRNGTQLQIPTVSFRVDDMIFGEEATSVVANEVAQGLRPAGWNNPADQQAQAVWRQTCAQHNAQVPNFQMGTFVNARIIMPSGVGIQLVDPETRQPINVQAPVAGTVPGVAANVGTVMPGQPAPAYTAPAPAAPAPAAPAVPAGYVLQADGTMVPAASTPAAAAPAPAAGAVY